jgi:hypothetical protein
MLKFIELRHVRTQRGLGLVQLLLFIALICVPAMTATGCGKKNLDWKAYNIADNEFTGLAGQYDGYYKLQPAPTQAKWKEKFDPVFDKGDHALTDWRKVLDAGGDPAMQMEAFNSIKADIVNVLFELSADGQK